MRSCEATCSREEELRENHACSCGESVCAGEHGSPAVIWIRCTAAIVLVAAGVLIPADFPGPILMGQSWLTWALHAAAWAAAGYDIALTMLRGLSKGRIFDENFLMTLATVGAFAIGATAEGAAVMIFYQVGEALSERAVRRSRRSISELCDIRPETAVIIDGVVEKSVPAGEVTAGQLILVRPGERIPLDGEVVDGVSTVDTAALTGESLPREASRGFAALAGTVNKTGVLKIRVTAELRDTVASRMLRLVEEAAERKAPAERFITRFARVYTPAVMLLAAAAALAQPLFVPGATVYDRVYSALVFLVTACPCALVVSIPLTYFAGIGGAAKAGVLVKGSSALDAMAKASLVIFDKTGTLTEGLFSVAEAVPAQGVDISTLNRCAAIAELRSSHPLAACLREYCGDVGYPADRYLEMPGLGVTAQFERQIIHAGSALYMKGLNITVPDVTGTAVHVALEDRAVGYYILRDSPRADSAGALSNLKKMGIKTAMLTGDTPDAAEQTARALGIDDFRAGLLPEGKLEAMESLMAGASGSTLFVGDGLNDAAALSRADAGVAMGLSGVDAALEAADVVLMADRPGQLVGGIIRARKTRAVAVQNIIFALGFKAAVLALGTIGAAPLWLAILADVGVTLLAVLNSLRARSA